MSAQLCLYLCTGMYNYNALNGIVSWSCIIYYLHFLSFTILLLDHQKPLFQDKILILIFFTLTALNYTLRCNSAHLCLVDTSNEMTT